MGDKGFSPLTSPPFWKKVDQKLSLQESFLVLSFGVPLFHSKDLLRNSFAFYQKRQVLAIAFRDHFSLRLGHARVLTTHRVVIHFARAALLPCPLYDSCCPLQSNILVFKKILKKAQKGDPILPRQRTVVKHLGSWSLNAIASTCCF